jgi:hypothetical protein
MMDGPTDATSIRVLVAPQPMRVTDLVGDPATAAIEASVVRRPRATSRSRSTRHART